MIKSTDRKRRAYSDSERTAGIRRWIERYPSATDATLASAWGVCRTTVRHHRAMLAREAEKR